MNTPPVANTASASSSSAARSAASRKAESAGNPFQQMLSEEMTSKTQNTGKPSERASDAANANKSSQSATEAPPEKAADKTATPAANATDKNQSKADEALSKEDSTEPNASTLSPELAAMVNSLLQRQAAAANGAAGKGDATDASATELTGKDLTGKDLTDLARAKQGKNMEPDLQASLQASLQSDAASDAELDMLTATTAQTSVDTAGDEARPAGFSSMLQQLTQAGPAGAARPGAPTVHAELAPRVGSNGWDQALGQRVVWMASGTEQSASLTLNPPELGPLQVVLNVSNNQANATFVAPHAEVRQALEAAMPKLREMLGEAGIQLDQASVSQGTPQQQNEFARSGSQGGSRGQGGEQAHDGVEQTAAESLASRRVTAAGNGLVDTFA
jgi:flagellar hook-length control protein FliK